MKKHRFSLIKLAFARRCAGTSNFLTGKATAKSLT